MIKICYVVTIPLTIESFFIPQLQYLAANGFDVTVVCSYDSKLQEKLGDSIRFLPIEIPRGISVSGSILALKSLTQFFKKEKFDLIQYSTPNAAFYSSIAAKRANCKVRNYHLMGLRYLGASGIGRIVLKTLERITCHNSTSIECVSKSNMEMGIKEGLFPKEKVTVVWNGSTGGVDLSRFDFSKRQQWRMEIRKEIGYSGSDFVYGFVGRITKDNVPIGDGTVVMAGAVINVSAKIGKGCIINTCASVDHDCVIENYVHIAVGAHVAGTSAIGDRTWIGAGATVSNNIRICDDCIIGAGAVVIKDIGQAGTYIGVPARMIR